MPSGRKGPDGLNDRQRAFVQEYIVDFNATQAAIRAGYAPRAAQEQSSRLLSKAIVGAAVAAAIQARSERVQISADDVLREVAALAFAHMGQYARWNDESVSLIDSAEVDPRAVSEVSQRMTRYGNNVSIKLHDKLAALTKLGEHLGLWKRDPDQGDGAVLNVNINTTASDG